jgi:hypothetical protein
MLKNIQSTGNKDTRSGFGDGIVEAARKNENIVALTSDLAGSLKLQQFMKEFPQRYIQCGIAEANMMGIAAGLTIGGKIPYTTTFANFSTGRVSVEGVETRISRLYGFIAPAGLPDYDGASPAQRTYGFICNASGLTGGVEGYHIW